VYQWCKRSKPVGQPQSNQPRTNCMWRFTIVVSANCKDTFILSTQKFQNTEKNLWNLHRKLEMCVCTSKIITHTITKQIYIKYLTMHMTETPSSKHNYICYYFLAQHFICLGLKLFGFLNFWWASSSVYNIYKYMSIREWWRRQ